MQPGLPVLASINPGNDLAELIQREGVGRVCTDHSADTLQRLAVELADEITSGKSVSTLLAKTAQFSSQKAFSCERNAAGSVAIQQNKNGVCHRERSAAIQLINKTFGQRYC